MFVIILLLLGAFAAGIADGIAGQVMCGILFVVWFCAMAVTLSNPLKSITPMCFALPCLSM